MNAPNQNPLRILLVEDVEADAELIRYELKKAEIHFSAKCVDSKRAFLRALREETPDLIISDYSLPQFNALDALHLLKSHRVSVPFILVTGSQSEEVAAECIKEGADDYILKSSLRRLPNAIVGALKTRQAERERAEAEAALRRREEQFRALIENSSDIITILNEARVIQYVSPSLERALGYTPEQVIGRNVEDLVHPADQQLVNRGLDYLRDRVIGKPLEYRFRHANGSWRHLESIGTNLLKTQGVSGIVVNTRDITERKRAEEQIREQAALLNKARDAIMVIDLSGRFLFWNQSAENLYGWKADEVSEKTHDQLLFADKVEPVDLRASTLAQEEWHGELHQVTREGKAILVESRWSLVKSHDAQAKSFLIINTDITEEKKLQAHFLRAQRMESIGTLAGGIAHDLNNVLTPIIMSIKMLRDELPPGTGHDILDTLETSAHRGASIVQQVLSFARGVEGEKAVFQLRHPLNEVLKIARDTFPQHIMLQSRIDKELWPVLGDPTQVHQIFMNLLVNARDAMPHGGRLQLDAQNTFIDESYARMQPDAKAGPYVVITVADTGTGIPPGLLPKIFEPFFTTKEVGKGTGLGLSTALGIVKSHNGFLTVYSEMGKGTSFKVHFPAAESSWDNTLVQEKTELPRGSNELILVVDDEEPIREIIKVTLEGNGYRVITAGDGTEAVALFAEKKSEINLVIADIAMPYMDGPATMRALRKLDPKARFMAVSGLMENDKLAEIRDLGQVEFLGKPFTTEQILIKLHRILHPA
ncbi:MAG: PAS domain S-box protein [Verrucomicrobiota bacterium]|nr:PAS domain S-box protein [Verrucomicrobiota bacterium]